MSKKNKIYPINQSPFYNLKSKSKLYKILNVDRDALNLVLKKKDKYYRQFSKADDNSDKIRHYAVPIKKLKILHHRLFSLLSRITPPDYLHSGTKGRSHITNAKTHIGNNELISLDIQKFYPSTRGWHVYDFFNNVLLCSPDVSAILKEIAVHNDHVPTGSCLSQKIAFFAHYTMFNEIQSFANRSNLTFTCFVDDLNLSGKSATRYHLNQIRLILKNRDLTSHPKKEKIFKKHHVKEVTGSIVTNTGLLLPNRKHKDIHERVQQIRTVEDSELKRQKLISLKGKAIAALQADPKILKRTMTLTNEVNRINKVI